MNAVIEIITCKLNQNNIPFLSKPLIIGGKAMEYYGMRKAGADIDLVITNEDYHKLAKQYPDNRKDIYGDLGVVINEFEIWRSIALLDYDFLRQNATDYGNVLMISLDKLLLLRVCAMEVEKYRNDLDLMKQYYYDNFRNQDYLSEANTHISTYTKTHGFVFGGQYMDD